MSVWQTYYRINEGTLMNIKKILAHVLMLMMMVNMAQGMNLMTNQEQIVQFALMMKSVPYRHVVQMMSFVWDVAYVLLMRS